MAIEGFDRNTDDMRSCAKVIKDEVLVIEEAISYLRQQMALITSDMDPKMSELVVKFDSTKVKLLEQLAQYKEISKQLTVKADRLDGIQSSTYF